MKTPQEFRVRIGATVVAALLVSACANSLCIPAPNAAEHGDHQLATQRQLLEEKSSRHATRKTLGDVLFGFGTAAIASGVTWLAINATNDEHARGVPVGLVVGGAFVTGAGVALMVDASARSDELSARRVAYAALLDEKAKDSEANKPKTAQPKADATLDTSSSASPAVPIPPQKGKGADLEDRQFGGW